MILFIVRLSKRNKRNKYPITERIIVIRLKNEDTIISEQKEIGKKKLPINLLIKPLLMILSIHLITRELILILLSHLSILNWEIMHK